METEREEMVKREQIQGDCEVELDRLLVQLNDEHLTLEVLHTNINVREDVARDHIARSEVRSRIMLEALARAERIGVKRLLQQRIAIAIGDLVHAASHRHDDVRALMVAEERMAFASIVRMAEIDRNVALGREAGGGGKAGALMALIGDGSGSRVTSAGLAAARRRRLVASAQRRESTPMDPALSDDRDSPTFPPRPPMGSFGSEVRSGRRVWETEKATMEQSRWLEAAADRLAREEEQRRSAELFGAEARAFLDLQAQEVVGRAAFRYHDRRTNARLLQQEEEERQQVESAEYFCRSNNLFGPFHMFRKDQAPKRITRFLRLHSARRRRSELLAARKASAAAEGCQLEQNAAATKIQIAARRRSASAPKRRERHARSAAEELEAAEGEKAAAGQLATRGGRRMLGARRRKHIRNAQCPPDGAIAVESKLDEQEAAVRAALSEEELAAIADSKNDAEMVDSPPQSAQGTAPSTPPEQQLGRRRRNRGVKFD